MILSATLPLSFLSLSRSMQRMHIHYVCCIPSNKVSATVDLKARDEAIFRSKRGVDDNKYKNEETTLRGCSWPSCESDRSMGLFLWILKAKRRFDRSLVSSPFHKTREKSDRWFFWSLIFASDKTRKKTHMHADASQQCDISVNGFHSETHNYFILLLLVWDEIILK